MLFARKKMSPILSPSAITRSCRARRFARHRANNADFATTQRRPRRAALVLEVLVGAICEPHAHIGRLRRNAGPARQFEAVLNRHQFIALRSGFGKSTTSS